MTAAEHAAPARVTAPPRTRGVDKEPLQVRIPVAIKRRFKSHAALWGLEPHELFVEVWEHYEASLKSETARAAGKADE